MEMGRDDVGLAAGRSAAAGLQVLVPLPGPDADACMPPLGLFGCTRFQSQLISNTLTTYSGAKRI